MLETETLMETFRTYLTIRIGELNLGPTETTILVLTMVAAGLSAYHLWRLGKQEDRRDRLVALRGVERIVRDRPRRWYERLGSLIAASPVVGTTEQEKLIRALAAAGIKGQSNLVGFVLSKVCAALVWTLAVWLFLEWRHLFAGTAVLRLATLFGALLVGWRIPDFVLKRLAARRRIRLEQGIPDALDLLVVCAEAGLSLDQAIEQVGQDLHAASPAVGEEFATTAAEMRVLSNRGEALENLAVRTGVASLRSITTTLSQAIRFGTPLAESMRILAAEMRNARLLRIEERAARLPVLLTIPLALFILPCLFIMIGTPVAIRVMDTLNNVHIGAP